MKLTSLRCIKGENVVLADYDMPSVNGELHLCYTLTSHDRLVVTQNFVPKADKAPACATHLPRFGMQLTTVPAFEKVSYYGRGPQDNYVDRKSSAFMGEYTFSPARQRCPYVRPQEFGNKTDVRVWRLYARDQRAITILATQPLQISTLPYTTADLDDGDDKAAHQSHSGDLEARRTMTTHIQSEQMGLGCQNSWGAWPREQYLLPYGKYSLTFTLQFTK